MAKAYRVYGSCSGWECHCEGTIRCFSDKAKATSLCNSLSFKEVVAHCGFCGTNDVETSVEELEIEQRFPVFPLKKVKKMEIRT